MLALFPIVTCASAPMSLPAAVASMLCAHDTGCVTRTVTTASTSPESRIFGHFLFLLHYLINHASNAYEQSPLTYSREHGTIVCSREQTGAERKIVHQSNYFVCRLPQHFYIHSTGNWFFVWHVKTIYSILLII